MANIGFIYVGICGVFLSLILVPLMKRLASRWQLVDRPDARKAHAWPTPLLGGLGIWLAFNLTVAFGLIFLVQIFPKLGLPLLESFNAFVPGVKNAFPTLLVISLGGFLIMLLGLVDDIKTISFKAKLLGQLFVAVSVAAAGVRITVFLPNLFLSFIVTVLWLIFIINAFNLMDNMDGLSSGVAIVAAAIFLIVSIQNGQVFVGAMLAIFVGVNLGFLVYNFPPASIFMGDSGSMFIGYMLAVLTIMNTYYTEGASTAMPVVMPLLILAVPIYDTLSVIYIRLKDKVSIFTADRKHFSHRLVNLGMRKPQAVVFIYLVSACVGMGALLLKDVPLAGGIVILIQAVIIVGIIAMLEKAGKNAIK